MAKHGARVLALALTLALMPAYTLAASEPAPDSGAGVPGDLQLIMPTMPVNPFSDVFGTDWFIDDVIYVFDKGLMDGTETEPMLFSPDMPMTRGMFITILWRLRGSPMLADYQSPFNDVDWQQAYFHAVQWASASKIVSGYGDGRFGPEDSITRQDAACILLSYMGHMQIVLPLTQQFILFADEAAIAEYAMDSVQAMYKLGVLEGAGTDANGQVIMDPVGEVSRAHAAATLHRFAQRIEAGE
ncbi:MAG: S-layer homology domain-containing protein [Clostridiales bacterium]|nr:S-layer homology domain-containing protein [Clostridiales bacterium]